MTVNAPCDCSDAERYGPDEQGYYLRRCRDHNVEWWEKADA